MVLIAALALVQSVASAPEGAADPMAALIAESAPSAVSPINCAGTHRQGAMIVCRTAPGADVSLGDITVSADGDGWVVLGHDRDAEPQTTLSVSAAGLSYEETVTVQQREYDIQRIEGVPQQYVTPPEEVLDRIRAEGREKRNAYQSRWAGDGFATLFEMPVEGRMTGVYGSQRYYNGEPRRPHYGIDIAAPGGTPVTAPAAGVVTLADPDMYYEGGLIFIDHGQGLTSAFLHLGAVNVEVGQEVAQGQVIGEVGSGGRSTGAHLDWRIKWHNRYIDPAAALEVDPSGLR
ncbi:MULTISPECIES: M23 family metallopeptidase [Oceanicaulis]|uniref:M23 family metallopeptidase n=1 Tax=Oceanicaulis TaxID=153232 RepID=UPI000EE3025C|nr:MULTISPECIES: M23 family metallopeptidase [Oceanicaulis]HCR65010.1 peptidase M23 [Oceanicaulis sp.]